MKTGFITEKNLLPITRLNFGRTESSTSSGAYTLGRMSCSGQQVLDKKPSSCADLSLFGYTLSGFYTVSGTESQQLETVYCKFNKLPTELGTKENCFGNNVNVFNLQNFNFFF